MENHISFVIDTAKFHHRNVDSIMDRDGKTYYIWREICDRLEKPIVRYYTKPYSKQMKRIHTKYEVDKRPNTFDLFVIYLDITTAYSTTSELYFLLYGSKFSNNPPFNKIPEPLGRLLMGTQPSMTLIDRIARSKTVVIGANYARQDFNRWANVDPYYIGLGENWFKIHEEEDLDDQHSSLARKQYNGLYIPEHSDIAVDVSDNVLDRKWVMESGSPQWLRATFDTVFTLLRRNIEKIFIDEGTKQYWLKSSTYNMLCCHYLYDIPRYLFEYDKVVKDKNVFTLVTDQMYMANNMNILIMGPVECIVEHAERLLTLDKDVQKIIIRVFSKLSPTILNQVVAQSKMLKDLFPQIRK